MRKVSAVFGRPASLRAFHGYAAMAWSIMAIPSVLWWKNSVPYLVMVSVYALFVGHFSSWQAARTEVKQDDALRKSEADEGN